MAARSPIPPTRRPLTGILSRLFGALLIVVLTLGSVVATPALGVVAAPNPFSDVAADDQAYEAITELAARDVIRGFACGQAARCFAPGEGSLRAQMAALIARASGWEAEDHESRFIDRCDPVQGCIDDALWRNVGTLQHHGVAKGFDPTHYAPHDPVLRQQVILFISRARQRTGEWTLQPDDARLYANSATDLADRRDIATYVTYAGAIPDAPTMLDQPWGEYGATASRGWFARALWQTYRPGTPVTAPSPGPGGPATSPNTAAFAARVLALTNARRLEGGCAALTANPTLADVAQGHAADMALQDYFAHVGKDGAAPDARVTRAGYAWRLVAENIAAGYPTPEAVVAGWMDSAGHRANILNCGLTQIGVGYYFLSPDPGTQQWQHYWVQVFATPR